MISANAVVVEARITILYLWRVSIGELKMVKVTINRKEYRVKEMQFGEYAKMEEQGFSIIDAFRHDSCRILDGL